MVVFLVHISGELVMAYVLIFAQPLCGNIRYFKYQLRNLFCSRVGILKHVSVFLQVKKYLQILSSCLKYAYLLKKTIPL